MLRTTIIAAVSTAGLLGFQAFQPKPAEAADAGIEQRPSAGWGSVEQIINPSHDGWEKAPAGDVAQRVQVSAFPDRCGQRAADAATIVDGIRS